MYDYLYIVWSHMPPYATFLSSCHWLANVVHQLVDQPPSDSTASALGSHLAEQFTPQSYAKCSEPPQIMSMPPRGRLFQMPLFFLFTDALQHVWACILEHEWVKVGRSCQYKTVFSKLGFPWAGKKEKEMKGPSSALSFACPHPACTLTTCCVAWKWEEQWGNAWAFIF